MNRVLSVDYKDKDDNNHRTYIDVAKGVVYQDASRKAAYTPIRRHKKKIQYWDYEKSQWANIRNEFNIVYEEYLKISKLVKNAEIDDIFDEILLGDDDEASDHT